VFSGQPTAVGWGRVGVPPRKTEIPPARRLSSGPPVGAVGFGSNLRFLPKLANRWWNRCLAGAAGQPDGPRVSRVPGRSVCGNSEGGRG